MTLRTASEVPDIWGRLLRVLGVPRPETKRLWHALAHATWSEPSTLRYRLLVFEYQLLNQPLDEARIQRFIDATLTPHHFCALAEALVGEGLLSRRDANTLEAAVLRRTGPAGTWVPFSPKKA
jgi:hypothetical protein